MKHTRTLQLEEDVLCVKFSPDHRLLAVSLLDCTVKVFYTDTLKVRDAHRDWRRDTAGVYCLAHSVCIITTCLPLLPQFFLSLYGHKLPVLCLDISHVSVLELHQC